MTILHFHPVETRSFRECSMAFAAEDEALRARAIAANALPSAGAIPMNNRGKSFLDVLSDDIRRTEATGSEGGN